ncbi:hypothetical protein CLV35_0653 [Motilibacter peucedani]|uniref:Uncharacterized protein n=1 Tax=Motilibacter peucedani TaxID=598650 RepID=A0A420XU04_9ACTN|nr:hypothetical protein [Motilibacter peucedani]RKS80230.1 hypothetical protein CLV35_0653 [Motilibacter peucedani]
MPERAILEHESITFDTDLLGLDMPWRTAEALEDFGVLLREGATDRTTATLPVP